MRTLLYCYRSGWINNVLGLALAGIMTKALTCPPLTAETFPYTQLGEVELIYIALHGSPKSRVLYGDNNIPALRVENVLTGPLLLPGAAVILEGCYGAKTAFPKAFLERGARVVIASQEKTLDRRIGLGAAGRIGSLLVKTLVTGGNVNALAANSGFEVICPS